MAKPSDKNLIKPTNTFYNFASSQIASSDIFQQIKTEVVETPEPPKFTFSSEILDPINNQKFINNYSTFNQDKGQFESKVPLVFNIKYIHNLKNKQANPFAYPNREVKYTIYLQKDNSQPEILEEESIFLNDFDVPDQSQKNKLEFNKKTIITKIENGYYQVYVKVEISGQSLFSKNKVSFIVETNFINTGNIQIESFNQSVGVVFQAPQLQTFLYKNSKNKVLFKIDKFFPISTFDYGLSNLDPKEAYNIVKKEFLSGLTAQIYRTLETPKSKDDMNNINNLYKTLKVENGEFSYDDLLETNKEYYYMVRVFHNSGANLTAGERLSDIQKIRVIKDESIYFLEKEVINFNDYIDKAITKQYLKKSFIEPKFSLPNSKTFQDLQKDLGKTFSVGNSTFDSSTNYPYIKLRTTSRKSKRKVDLNLNYVFLPKIQDLKYIQELNGKDFVKLNTEEIKSSIFTLQQKDFNDFKTAYLANIVPNFILTKDKFDEFIKFANEKSKIPNPTARFILFNVFEKLQITLPKIKWIEKPDNKNQSLKSGIDIKPTIEFFPLDNKTEDYIPLTVQNLTQEDINNYLDKFKDSNADWKETVFNFLESLQDGTEKVDFDNLINKIIIFIEDYKKVYNKSSISIETNKDSSILKFLDFTAEDLNNLKGSNNFSAWENYTKYQKIIPVILSLFNKLKQSIVVKDIIFKQ